MKGRHLAIDLYNCTWWKVQDPTFLQTSLVDIIKLAKMRPIQVYDPIIYDDFDSIFGWGISQVVILAESHATYHTTPEKKSSLFFDIYSCKDFEVNKVINFLLDRFNPDRYEVHNLIRNRFLEE